MATQRSGGGEARRSECQVRHRVPCYDRGIRNRTQARTPAYAHAPGMCAAGANTANTLGRSAPNRTATTMAADMDVKQRFFPHTQDELKEIASDILRHAKSLGGTDAATEISEGDGLSVSVRRGEVETIEHNRDKMVGVTVFIGNKRGNASTSDFSPQALEGHGRGGLQHRPLHGRRRLRGSRRSRAAGNGAARSRSLSPVESVRGRSGGNRPPRGRRRVRDRSAHQEFGRRERLGTALAVRAGHLARFPGGLSVLAPLHRVRADCGQRPQHAARRLVHVDPQRRRAGRSGSRRPLCGATRAGAHRRARSGYAQVPVLFEAPLAAGLLGAFVQARAAARCIARPRSSSTASASRCSRRTCRWSKTRTSPGAMGSAPFDEEGVRTAPAFGGEGRRGGGLFPVDVLGAQARHANHRQCRRLAQPVAAAARTRVPRTTSKRCCASSARACC